MSRDRFEFSPTYAGFIFIGAGIIMLIAKWYPLVGGAIIALGISIIFGSICASSKEAGRGTTFPLVVAIVSFVAFVAILVYIATK